MTARVSEVHWKDGRVKIVIYVDRREVIALNPKDLEGAGVLCVELSRHAAITIGDLLSKESCTHGLYALLPGDME